MRVDLSDGQWADILDIADCTEEEYEQLYLAVVAPAALADKTPDVPAWKRMKAHHRAQITALVREWSLGEPIPSVDPSVLGRIRARDFALLVRAAEAAEGRLYAEVAPADAEPGSDPS